MERQLIGEWMDRPDVDSIEHRRALTGLRRINALSRTAAAMARPVLAFAQARRLDRIRILDVASGAGDVPIQIARMLDAAGIGVHLTLFDQSDAGLTDAQERAGEIPVDWALGSALEALPKQDYDVVTCSLFLHHLDRAECIAALMQMKGASRGLIVVSDLERGRAGLVAAQVGCRLLSRSPLVHHDGPASVRGAWTREELHELARDAGLTGATIRRCFPWRLLLTHRCV